MGCPHTPLTNMINATLSSVNQNLLEAKMAAAYNTSAEMQRKNAGLNKAGYESMIFEIYEATGFVPGKMNIPENHAGFENFIEERFPNLYKKIVAQPGKI
jgi:hypothetical protein